jgi:hypothetical protein
VVKEFSMRIKKRVKRGVRKGIKKIKSAPPEGYLAGGAVLVGSAAVLLLATTKRGRELLRGTTQPGLPQDADEQESQNSDLPEPDEQEAQSTDLPKPDEQEAQSTDLPKPDEQEARVSDGQEELDNEPAENADLEGEPGKETDGTDESRVTDLKPRQQRPRSAAPGRHPRRPQEVAHSGGELTATVDS